MAINRALHPTATVARLYLPWNEGGQRLKAVEQVIRTEEHRLSDYLHNKGVWYNTCLQQLVKNRSKKVRKPI